MPEISGKAKKKFDLDPKILLGGEPKNSKSAAHQTPFQRRKAQVIEAKKYEGTDLNDTKLLAIVQEKLSQL